MLEKISLDVFQLINILQVSDVDDALLRCTVLYFDVKKKRKIIIIILIFSSVTFSSPSF